MNKTETNITAKPGYKKTKLGWIPEEWEIKKLGKLFEFRNGVNAGKEDYGKGIKFVNVLDVLENTFLTEEKILGFVQLSDNQIDKNLVIRGDVLFNRTSETQDEIGLTTLYNDDTKVVFGGFVIRGRPKNDLLDHKYNGYSFQSGLIRKQIISKGQGAIRVNIGQSDLEQIIFPIPPLPEQKKIAEILSTWDEAIQKMESLIQKKEQLKRGLMQQLLTGKKRFDGFEGEWKLKSIKSFSRVVTGSTPRTNNPKFYKGDYLFVSPSDMGDVKYIVETEKTLTKEGFEEGRMIPKGATLFVSIGSTIGKTAIAGSDLTTNQQIHAIISDENICLNEFFYYQLSRISNRIKLLAGKQAVPIINKSNFQSIKVSFPSIQEQTKIVAILSSLEYEIEELMKIKQVYEKQKKGLMQQLLTGKKRLNRRF